MRLEIHGRVQGVFFRQTLKQSAERLGLSGGATNQPDGTVLAFLEGSPDAVEKGIEIASSGPPAASVDRVDISDEPSTGDAGFTIG